MRNGETRILRFKAPTGGRRTRASTEGGVRRLMALAPILGQRNPAGLPTAETVIRSLINAPTLCDLAVSKPRPLKMYPPWVRTQATLVDQIERVVGKIKATMRGIEDDLQARQNIR